MTPKIITLDIIFYIFTLEVVGVVTGDTPLTLSKERVGKKNLGGKPIFLNVDYKELGISFRILNW